MRTYTIVVEPEDTGGYMVLVPALPGCFTQGATLDECRERAAEAIAVHIAGLEADGEPGPHESATPQLMTVTIAPERFPRRPSRCPPSSPPTQASYRPSTNNGTASHAKRLS